MCEGQRKEWGARETQRKGGGGGGVPSTRVLVLVVGARWWWWLLRFKVRFALIPKRDLVKGIILLLHIPSIYIYIYIYIFKLRKYILRAYLA